MMNMKKEAKAVGHFALCALVVIALLVGLYYFSAEFLAPQDGF